MNKTAYLLASLISLALLASCGGGEGSEKITTPQPIIPTLPVVDAIFTEDNAGDIAIWSTVLTEASIDAADIIEQEIIWFHHAPENILIRDCNSTGSVEKIIDDTESSYQLVFTNCSYQTDIIDRENSTTTVTALVNITQQDIQLDNSESPYSDSFLIKGLSAKVSSTRFIISTVEEPSLSLELMFELLLTSNQTWSANTEDLSGDLVVNYQSKNRKLDIKAIDFKVTTEDLMVVTDSMRQTTINQHINAPKSNKYPHYKVDITSTITSELFAFETTLTSTVTSPYSGKGYAPQSPAGTFALTNAQNEEILLTLITNKYMQLHLNKELIGEAETVEWTSSALFNLHDNAQALAFIQELTPFKAISITKETLENDPVEKVIIKFNKKVSIDSGYSNTPIQVSTISVSNSFYQPSILATENNIILSFDTNESKGFYDIYYDGNYKLKTSEKYVEQSSGGHSVKQIVGIVGQAVTLDHTVEQVRYSSVYNHLIAINDFNTVIKVFDLETGHLINASEETNIVFDNICFSADQEGIFLTGINYDDYSYQIFSYDHKTLTFIESYQQTGSAHSVIKCAANQLIFVNDDSFEQFNLSTTDFVLTDIALANVNNIVQSPLNGNQLLYVSDTDDSGYELFSLTLDPLEIEAVATSLEDSRNTYNYSGGQERAIFIDAVNENILARNTIIKISDTSEILHTFTGEEIYFPKKNEHIRYHNEAHNIIVTNLAVYDASTFAELIALPPIPAASYWFVDNDDRLSVVLQSMDSIYRVKLY
ncbi:hypothetical protein [Colwellia hornerae]|uniref:Uncharacterized protein n=1 Tax=Colwellia hornerae TaxID=89402 RepID=A0A5C6QGM9_9GAMM|nr:hypothetical protein [Colwellia hornerae]TWX55261.1 hypothetical protein ESZ28_07075 [Colwellia hornerae]TWX61261.1 hypothetical protein ESZ26_05850 [Colwellia hornerae]TWX67692.1 hypothetical protein ESZ27_08190 [Colwellia hornerae]